MKRALAATAVAALFLAGCSTESTDSAESNNAKGTDTFAVYATTGYLADAVKNILPTAEVTTMVGPGGDPHTYQPSTKDIEKMNNADFVLWNGLHLEAQMEDQLESFDDKQLAVGEQLPKDMLLGWDETGPHGEELHDPHIWNSPEAWLMVVDFIVDKLSEMLPEQAKEIEANGEAYSKKIEEAAAEAHTKMDKVKEPRILITGHDAFNYFGKTFDLEIHATDFISTEAALSAGEISQLADLIAEKKVPVIFQDNQANPQAINSLKEAVKSRGWDVVVSDEELFADSLGADEGVDTYLGAFNHNVNAVSKALS